jgi:hypothetical protein
VALRLPETSSTLVKRCLVNRHSIHPRDPTTTAGSSAVLLRPAYLGLINTFALLRLIPVSNRDKDIEIVALRHQIGVLQRQLGDTRPTVCWRSTSSTSTP